jgi:hypothetical protein
VYWIADIRPDYYGIAVGAFADSDFPPPGYDPQNGNPPIPAGFFGPGSLPFDGVVEFLGQPLDVPNTARTDTLIEHPSLRFGFCCCQG